jgi:hypothetical protein
MASVEFTVPASREDAFNVPSWFARVSGVSVCRCSDGIYLQGFDSFGSRKILPRGSFLVHQCSEIALIFDFCKIHTPSIWRQTAPGGCDLTFTNLTVHRLCKMDKL